MEEEMKENIKTTIKKNQKADIPTKNGNNYSYQYVDIAQIHEYLESIKARYIQQTKRIDGDDYVMTKRCFDNKWEDEWLQGARIVQATLVGNNNPAQEQGSALTYARRYSLLMAFGLATEDDDANSLNKNNFEKKATSKQIDILLEYYEDDNLTKLLEKNNLKNIEDISMTKASELIKKIYDKRGGIKYE